MGTRRNPSPSLRGRLEATLVAGRDVANGAFEVARCDGPAYIGRRRNRSAMAFF
jgi:hypothetical protein